MKYLSKFFIWQLQGAEPSPSKRKNNYSSNGREREGPLGQVGKLWPWAIYHTERQKKKYQNRRSRKVCK